MCNPTAEAHALPCACPALPSPGAPAFDMLGQAGFLPWTAGGGRHGEPSLGEAPATGPAPAAGSVGKLSLLLAALNHLLCCTGANNQLSVPTLAPHWSLGFVLSPWSSLTIAE